MSSPFPFQITAAPAPVSPEYQFVIFADVGGLEDYYALFQHFGFGGTAASWVEHIETIIEEHQPGLLDEMEFVEGDHTFVAYASGQVAVDQFLACVLPFFDTLPHLQKYLSQADPDDFFA
ncbi:hypothetical protein [Hymenobacter terricola]|uniref:hypothetical protein n=1 Tax=Hymenobacter terricola TaxID=2819236 RepID=UPI001B3141AD|nr:hypothetical protein [Hymenobacter terricola]